MEISDLETYEQLQMEATLRSMTIPEFIKESFYQEISKNLKELKEIFYK